MTGCFLIFGAIFCSISASQMVYFHMISSSFSTPHHSQSTISATIFGFLVIPQKNGLHIRNQHPQLPPYPSKPQNAHFYPYFPKFFTKSENLKNCLLIPYYSNIIIFIDRETEISTRFSVFTEWKKFLAKYMRLSCGSHDKDVTCRNLILISF